MGRAKQALEDDGFMVVPRFRPPTRAGGNLPVAYRILGGPPARRTSIAWLPHWSITASVPRRAGRETQERRVLKLTAYCFITGTGNRCRQRT